MSVIRKYKPGEFCWTDVGTKDVTAAKKFYKGIFGWRATDFPMGEGAKYSMMRVGGKDVAGLYPMSDEQRKAKAPPFWLPYVCVRSVDATLKKVKTAGGKLCLGPVDVMGQGRMAIIQDPTSATVGLWQARAHRGAALAGKPGTMLWHDLNTLKPRTAGKFYVKVFGWTLIDRDIDGHKYYQFNLGKVDVCGMWPEPTRKLPPSWIAHWKVADCAKTATRAKRLGGRVVLGPIAIGAMGHFALLKDPRGAAFGIIGK